MRRALDIHTLDPADERQMRPYFEVARRAETEDGRPWNTFFTYSELSTLLREPSPERQVVGLCAVDDHSLVAVGMLQLFLLDNLDKAWLIAAVDPGLRGRGLGGAVLEALVEAAHRNGRTVLLSDAAVPLEGEASSDMLRFAARHGFALNNREVHRILGLPVAEDELDRLARQSSRDDYTVETYVDRVPERHLASLAHLHNQLILDAPTGEVDFEAAAVTPEIERQKLERNRRMGRTTFITLAVLAGEAVAHSDLVVPPDRTEAHQMGTLVRRDHRGHRLGTAVKVANLRALQRDRPDVTQVHTQNAETNPWMVAINESLGFEPVGACLALLRTD